MRLAGLHTGILVQNSDHGTDFVYKDWYSMKKVGHFCSVENETCCYEADCFLTLVSCVQCLLVNFVVQVIESIVAGLLLLEDCLEIGD